MKRISLIWLWMTVLFVIGCSSAQGAPNDLPPVEEPVQIPEEAQAYIDISREALAQQLDVDPEQFELDSITEPATVEGTYIVKLVFEGWIYEYHGHNGEVAFISKTTPS